MSGGADIVHLAVAAEALKVDRLEGLIADALAAMDEGRYGDARRILRTGKAAPVIAATGILTKGQ